MNSKSPQSAPADPLLLTVTETARSLAISERHVWNLVAAGKLPRPVRLGKSSRWVRRDIEAYIESLKIEQPEPNPSNVS